MQQFRQPSGSSNVAAQRCAGSAARTAPCFCIVQPGLKIFRATVSRQHNPRAARQQSALAIPAAAAVAGVHVKHRQVSRGRLAAARASGKLDLNSLGIDVPDIDAADVASYKQELGAEFNDSGVAVTFNNTKRVVEALQHGAVLIDRSHWGRVRLSGPDRLDFLHNQSTADFKAVQPGQGCDTVFVTATARCLDLATALLLENSVMLLTSPNMKQPLLERLDKYIFPADQVTITDVSDKCSMLTLMGPQADDVMTELAGDAFQLKGQPYGRHQLLRFGSGAPVIIAVGSGLTIPGYTLIVDSQGAADLYATIINKGCVPMGDADWERARVTQGRPAAGAELTEQHNPLEAGLCHAVSLDKGCFIGQETLAKLTNTNGVKQQLWGLQLADRAVPGAVITATEDEGGETVGRLTSYVNLEDNGHFGLGYIRCRKNGAQVFLKGITVAVDGQPAKVVEVPYVTRQLPKAAATAAAGGSSSSNSASQAAGDDMQDRAAAAKAAKEAEKVAAEAAKAERLRAMQERLAAWQAQQQQ